MIKPSDIDDAAWEVITAAASGDAEDMRRLLADNRSLSRQGYFYTPPIHFAVREGHTEIGRSAVHGARIETKRVSLVRDPRFAATVNDIVVEFGNARLA